VLFVFFSLKSLLECLQNLFAFFPVVVLEKTVVAELDKTSLVLNFKNFIKNYKNSLS
jgi:hypothetical protein